MTTALGNRADVHAATLRAVAAGVRTPVVRATRQAVSARSGSTPVHVLRVHPWVWAIALILADGDTRRITVESETTGIVR
jgi:hypothetical protein